MLHVKYVQFKVKNKLIYIHNPNFETSSPLIYLMILPTKATTFQERYTYFSQIIHREMNRNFLRTRVLFKENETIFM